MEKFTLKISDSLSFYSSLGPVYGQPETLNTRSSSLSLSK